MKLKLLIPLLFLLMLVPTVQAEKGIGIVWSTQQEIVVAGQENCIEYGIYNPFDEDARIFLTASAELEPLVQPTTPQLVVAGTSSSNAIRQMLCFDIPKSCTGEYSGEVIASEEPEEATTGSAGSTARAMASAPLTLKSSCPQSTLPTGMIIIVAIIAIMILFPTVMFRKKLFKFLK